MNEHKINLTTSNVSVLIPAFNEGEYIAEVVRGALRSVCRVLVVDDGSADRTVAVAKDAGAEVICHPENRGKGAALRTGFELLLADGSEAIVVLDGDGQHDPEELPAFIKRANERGADIVVGNRLANAAGMPRVRYWTNRAMSIILSWLSQQKIPDSQCGYRLIRREVLESINFTTENYDLESEMLILASRLGFKIASVPIKTIYTGQVSEIKPGRDTVRFLRLICKYLKKDNS
ncbi:MAG TPA: glycosyltransferase family 2 protein [Proteobacteria bacterium]|nr:glycosyltransferase family 2 protein [Pseudomonadota bacterium]